MILGGGRSLNAALDAWKALSDPPTFDETAHLKKSRQELRVASNEVGRQRARASMRLPILSPILTAMGEVRNAMETGRCLITGLPPTDGEVIAAEEALETVSKHHARFVTLAWEFVHARVAN